MMTRILIPQLSANITEATVTEWLPRPVVGVIIAWRRSRTGSQPRCRNCRS